VATEQVTGFEFTPEGKKKIRELAGRYPDAQAATLPALWAAQEEAGWISPEVCTAVAELLGVTPAHVLGVASFYTMFKKATTGRYLIQVCSTLSCSLMGAESVVDYLERKLGIRCGETTPDGKFTLMKVECLASCGTAPVMQINDDYYESLTEAKIDEILAGLE
jgi:NADH-quinone oxidoreductase subunit E